MNLFDVSSFFRAKSGAVRAVEKIARASGVRGSIVHWLLQHVFTTATVATVTWLLAHWHLIRKHQLELADIQDLVTTLQGQMACVESAVAENPALPNIPVNFPDKYQTIPLQTLKTLPTGEQLLAKGPQLLCLAQINALVTKPDLTKAEQKQLRDAFSTLRLEVTARLPTPVRTPNPSPPPQSGLLPGCITPPQD